MSLIKPMGFTKRLKGGGIDEYKQYAADELKNQYEAGNLSKVAGTNEQLEDVFNRGASDIKTSSQVGAENLRRQQARLEDLAKTGGIKELTDTAVYEAAKQKADIDRQAGAGGVLGSARNQLRTGAMESELLAGANKQAIQNKINAEERLGASTGATQKMLEGANAALLSLGKEQRNMEQQELSKDEKGVKNLLSGAVLNSGGGK